MTEKKTITGLSVLVLAQIALFMLVYAATIGIGVGLVYLAFRASVWIIPLFIDNVVPEILHTGRAGLFLLGVIIVAYVGLWAFVVAVGVFLLKPLFLRSKRNNDYGREIRRKDSPELYDMIMKTAKEVGVRRPRHIYVNHDVNACVFFNTGFWNIFLPVRKNLAIGLGLFESMSADEVRSIIAHEFGHFAQGSMRVGSVLYVANRVITDLVYRRDKLDARLLRWCLQNSVWGFWGKATQSVVIRFRNLVEYMYRMQQRNYMKLSRQMEYDADVVSCRVVGTATFVSALCKVQKLSRSFDFYNQVLDNFAGRHQAVPNYWEGYEMTVPHMDAAGIRQTSFDTVESLPDTEGVKSRVMIEEVWESHPSVENRIGHARALAVEGKDTVPGLPAWNLVSPGLKADVSSDFLKRLKKKDDSVSAIEWKAFSEGLAEMVDVSIFPKEVEVFFDRDLITDASSDEPLENPFTDECRAFVKEYEQALRDRHLLALLDAGKIPVKSFLYDGKEYSVDNVPLSEHDRYLGELRREVVRIDAAIKACAESKVEKTSLIAAAYDDIGYAQSVTASLRKDFLPVRDDIIRELNEVKIAGKADFDNMRAWLESYEDAVKSTLRNLKYSRLFQFMTEDEHKRMMEYLDAAGSFVGSIAYDAVNHMFAVTDWILRVHDNLIHANKMAIIKAILYNEQPEEESDMPEQSGTAAPEEDNSAPDREHVVIDSPFGRLDLVVPTDEEIETIGYSERFRAHMWKKYDKLERGQKFDYSLVGTVPYRENDGYLSCVNPEDEGKLMMETEEYYRFFEEHSGQEPDWSKMMDAAEQGDAHANSRMAELYMMQGRHEMAFEAAMKGALGGDVDGIVMLGILERTGERAVNLFKCAAASGNMHALCNLGLRYAKGEGIEKDEAKAIVLFERAAFQGNVNAQNNVGYMYLYGKGAEADPDNGLAWFYKAANSGYEPAVNNIWQYYKSIGDTEQYLEVVQLGAQNGVEECLKELDIINMQGSRPANVLNYDTCINNPAPVLDTAAGQDICPVCGKPLPPHATTCPHCKEIIFEPEE